MDYDAVVLLSDISLDLDENPNEVLSVDDQYKLPKKEIDGGGNYIVNRQFKTVEYGINQTKI